MSPSKRHQEALKNGVLKPSEELRLPGVEGQLTDQSSSPGAGPFRWLWSHDEMKYTSSLDLLPGDERNIERQLIQSRRLNVDVLGGIVRRLYAESFTVGKRD